MALFVLFVAAATELVLALQVRSLPAVVASLVALVASLGCLAGSVLTIDRRGRSADEVAEAAARWESFEQAFWWHVEGSSDAAPERE